MVKPEIIQSYVEQTFKNFGPNKLQEVSRLLFEISKREQVDLKEIIRDIPDGSQDFSRIRGYLIKRRFPTITAQKQKVKYVLPKLEFDSRMKVDIDSVHNDRRQVVPGHFYIEEAVKNTDFAERLKEKYSNAQFTVISNYKEYTKENGYKVSEYNNRLKQFFIIREDFDFFKRCACSNKSVYCGYHVINLGSGCAFECTYCYLQDYLNSPGIVLPANLSDFFESFEAYKQNIRLGSGEITDSLVFDHISEYSPQIVEFFRDYPNSSFEFKTKSDNIDLLFKVAPSKNIIISWSISPQTIIESTEFYTASLKKRLAAAQRCAEYGYTVAFHLDPIIHYPKWEEEYQVLINEIFDKIDPKNIACISIGTLRMTPRLKKIIENRFPENTLLDEEFALAYDGKLRYNGQLRREIYTKILDWIKGRAPQVYAYLCMEEKSVCGDCNAAPLKK